MERNPCTPLRFCKQVRAEVASIEPDVAAARMFGESDCFPDQRLADEDVLAASSRAPKATSGVHSRLSVAPE
jgi:hypothetical protein